MTVLGIDIGGTKVALRTGGGARPYRAAGYWAGPGSLSADLEQVQAAVAAAVTEAGRPAGIGVAFPGTVDPTGTVTAWPNRPWWTGLRWHDVLGTLVPGVPADSGDDGDLAALAEAEHAGLTDLVYVGVGTGIGGGVVVDGRSVPGRGRGSCELGHTVVLAGGPACDCGRRGCLQSVASGPALLRRAGRRRGARITSDGLRRDWVAGVEPVAGVVREGCTALAAALVSVAELTGVRTAIVGGGLAAGLPGFTDAVADAVAGLARTGHDVPEVRPAALEGTSSLDGALLLARQIVPA